MCTVETSAPPQSKHAVEEGHFEDLTVIVSDPESTCTAEPHMESADLLDTSCDGTLGSFRVISHDPFTLCVAECKLVNGNGRANPPLQSVRYKPAYTLQDESLERAGRVSGTTLGLLGGA